MAAEESGFPAGLTRQLFRPELQEEEAVTEPVPMQVGQMVIAMAAPAKVGPTRVPRDALRMVMPTAESTLAEQVA